MRLGEGCANNGECCASVLWGVCLWLCAYCACWALFRRAKKDASWWRIEHAQLEDDGVQVVLFSAKGPLSFKPMNKWWSTKKLLLFILLFIFFFFGLLVDPVQILPLRPSSLWIYFAQSRNSFASREYLWFASPATMGRGFGKGKYKKIIKSIYPLTPDGDIQVHNIGKLIHFCQISPTKLIKVIYIIVYLHMH